MTILYPDHLFEQPDRLVAQTSGGAPRQVDLRRAISAAYYGLFHFAMKSLADEFVGVTQRATGRYALAYRAIDHRTLKTICFEAGKPTPSARYAAYVPVGGFSNDIQAFTTTVVQLQDKRHVADYDPLARFATLDAKLAVAAARSAVRSFARADADHCKALLTLLLLSPR